MFLVWLRPLFCAGGPSRFGSPPLPAWRAHDRPRARAPALGRKRSYSVPVSGSTGPRAVIHVRTPGLYVSFRFSLEVGGFLQKKGVVAMPAFAYSMGRPPPVRKRC